MKQYQETPDGYYTIDGMTIPKTSGNRHYRRMLKEIADGDAEIIPYIQDLEELRREKISAIKAEGLKRIATKVDALGTFDMAMLVYKHMWPVSSASSELTNGKATFDYAKDKIVMAKTATRSQLEAYDPATDPGWPA